MSLQNLFPEIEIASLSSFEQLSLAICFLRGKPQTLELFANQSKIAMQVVWNQLSDLPLSWAQEVCRSIIAEGNQGIDVSLIYQVTLPQQDGLLSEARN